MKKTAAKKILMTPAQKEDLEKRIPYGTDFSNWARAILLGEKVQSRPIPKIDPAILKATNRIGTNLNQLVRKINSPLFEYEIEDKAEIIIELRKTQAHISNLVKACSKKQQGHLTPKKENTPPKPPVSTSNKITRSKTPDY